MWPDATTGGVCVCVCVCVCMCVYLAWEDHKLGRGGEGLSDSLERKLWRYFYFVMSLTPLSTLQPKTTKINFDIVHYFDRPLMEYLGLMIVVDSSCQAVTNESIRKVK